MSNLLNQHKNLIRILILGAIAFIIVFMIASKVKSGKPKTDDGGRKEIIAQYIDRVPQTTKNPYELVITGVKLLNAQEYEMAQATLEQATEKDEKYRDGWLYLGMAYLKNNLDTESVKALEQAKEIDPLYPQIYKYLATAYQKTGNAELAKECYDKYEKLSK